MALPRATRQIMGTLVAENPLLIFILHYQPFPDCYGSLLYLLILATRSP